MAWATFAKWFPALITLIFAGYIVSKARMPESKPGEMQIYEFGKLPLAYQGRVKPYDTLARNTLQIISSRQQVEVWNSDGKVTDGVPAIHWLLDAISGHPRADDHQVFRIENLDVLDTLGLEPRPGFWRYSINEILKKPGELDRQVKLATSHARGQALAVPKQNAGTVRQVQLLLAGRHCSFRSPPMSTEPDKM